MRAGVLKQRERRLALKKRLSACHWHDAPPVAKRAFEITVRDAYSPRVKALDVASMAVRMSEYFASDGIEKFTPDVAEALLRAARGEEVATDHIPEGAAFIVYGSIFMALANDLPYSEAELDAVLVEAERFVFDHGFSPTLA